MNEVESKVMHSLDNIQEYFLAFVQSGISAVEVISEEVRALVSCFHPSSIYIAVSNGLIIPYDKTSIFVNHTLSLTRRYFHPVYLKNCFHEYTASLKSWNTSHLCAGFIAFCVGGGIGMMIGSCYQPYVQYLTPMKTIVASNYTGIEGITIIEESIIPIVTSSDEILVRVKAASLDAIDLQISTGYGRVLRRLYKNGFLKRKRAFPIILGRDCAGVVIEVGSQVKRFEVGDAVWLAVPYWVDGTFAEYVVVKECYVSLKPKVLDFDASAALPFSGCLAWNAVCNKAHLNSMSAYIRRVMVHCGHTPTGSIIVQLCHAFGAHVTVTCVEHTRSLMMNLGAQEVLLLETLALNVYHVIPRRDRFDVVFNTVGDNASNFCSMLCRPDGMVVNTFPGFVISDTYGPTRVKFYSLWLKIRKTLFGYNIWKDMPLNSTILEELSSLVNDGKLRPVVPQVFNFYDCDKAFNFICNTKYPVGKPVILFSSGSSPNKMIL